MRLPPLRTWSRGLHGRVVFPLIAHVRGEGSLFDHLAELRALEGATQEDLRDRQDRRLAAILGYAARRSPRYRSELGEDLEPSPDEARRILRRLAPLEKDELQRDADRIRARPSPSRVSRKTTGGSTGEPVTVLKDREGTAWNRATFWYGVGWNGVRIGDRGARFWGSPAGASRRRLRYWAADVAMNRLRLSAFDFGEEDLEAYWERCLLFRPDYFYGYVSMLEAFARHLRERDHDGSRLGLKAVVTTAEVLGEPQRNLLEEVLCAPVQNEYGCGEIGPIAYECDRGSLHVMTENVLVELLGEDGESVSPGETGEVVVTDLHNRAMPLLRYRLGDFAVQGSRCGCGHGFPVLERIWGREYDFVVTPEGRRMHGEYFLYLFEDLRDEGLEIEQFRVTQRDRRTIEVEIVAPEAVAERTTERVRRGLTSGLEGMEVEVRPVDGIAREPSGKMRVVRNDWLTSNDAG